MPRKPKRAKKPQDQRRRVEQGDLSNILKPLSGAEREHMEELIGEAIHTLERAGLSRDEAIKALTSRVFDLWATDGSLEQLEALRGFLDAKAKAHGKLS